MTTTKEAPKDLEGKKDWSLLPAAELENIIDVYQFGVDKYGRESWKAGFQYHKIYAAALRHLTAFWRGQDVNMEDGGLYHLAQVAWNALTLLWMLKNGVGVDDRPTKGGGR